MPGNRAIVTPCPCGQLLRKYPGARGYAPVRRQRKPLSLSPLLRCGFSHHPHELSLHGRALLGAGRLEAPGDVAGDVSDDQTLGIHNIKYSNVSRGRQGPMVHGIAVLATIFRRERSGPHGPRPPLGQNLASFSFQ